MTTLEIVPKEREGPIGLGFNLRDPYEEKFLWKKIFKPDSDVLKIKKGKIVLRKFRKKPTKAEYVSTYLSIDNYLKRKYGKKMFDLALLTCRGSGYPIGSAREHQRPEYRHLLFIDNLINHLLENAKIAFEEINSGRKMFRNAGMLRRHPLVDAIREITLLKGDFSDIVVREDISMNAWCLIQEVMQELVRSR